MSLTLVPIIAIIVGILLWVMPLPPKVQEAGRILFAVGAFWLVGGEHGPGIQIR